MEGGDEPSAAEAETMASSNVIDDFDQLEARPQSASPAREQSEGSEAESESLREESEAEAEVEKQNTDLEEIELPEPVSRSPMDRPRKAEKVSSLRPDEIAPFEPLSQYLDPEYDELSDSSEDEGMPDYKIGGYHPVHVGEVFMGRYVIIQKLGWGHFSTVWLTKDLKYETYVAMKIQKSSQNYLEAAYDEVEILDQASSNWQKQEWQDSVKEYYKGEPDMEKWKGPEGCACV